MEAASRNASTAQEIERLGPWFHNLTIDGCETAPNHFLGDYPSFKWAGFKQMVPEDLSGATVLDVGCNAGFYSFEMKRRGADRVVAIDTDPHYLAQARYASERLDLPVELHQMAVYDVEKLAMKFDLVIFMGVLYHLRHPLLALDRLREHAVGDLMLFQCMQRGSDQTPAVAADYDFADWQPFNDPRFPAFYFIEHRYAGDPTNWFIPNKAAVEALLRTAGFTIVGNAEREVYLCGLAEHGSQVG